MNDKGDVLEMKSFDLECVMTRSKARKITKQTPIMKKKDLKDLLFREWLGDMDHGVAPKGPSRRIERALRAGLEFMRMDYADYIDMTNRLLGDILGRVDLPEDIRLRAVLLQSMPPPLT